MTAVGRLPRSLAEPSIEDPSADGALRAAVVEVSSAELDGTGQSVVARLRERVSVRLTADDTDYAPTHRRELTRALIAEEYEAWLAEEARAGRPAPLATTEERILAGALAELDGLGRLAPLLAREDVEDIHFEGCEPTVLRLAGGALVRGPRIASTDDELVALLRAVGGRSGDGQASREFSSASPVLNIRLQGVTALGARLQAAMDVLPRPAGVIRVHRFADPGLADLRRLGMVDRSLEAFLRHAVVAGASPLVTGAPGVGKTTLMRALGNAIPFDSVVVTVEDERELGLHVPRWDPIRRAMVPRHAVCRPFESRLPNAEGEGGFDMGQALHLALRTSPTWVLVGEVRGAYVVHLLEAATSGIASVMCTIHSPSADGVFDKVLINALKADPTPSTELVLRSLAALDLVIHVERDRDYRRFVSGVYELGPVGDSGRPSLTPVFAPRPGDRRAVPTGLGALSAGLAGRLEATDFDAGWLRPDASDWDGERSSAAGWAS